MTTYGSGLSARALRIPVRRLEGWAEQGVLSPRQARRGRRQYTWDDLMKAAVLVELQALFGPNLRPGSVGGLLSKTPEYYFGHLTSPAFPQDPNNPILVICYLSDGKPCLALGTRSNDGIQRVLHSTPTLFQVNLTVLGERIREVLDG